MRILQIIFNSTLPIQAVIAKHASIEVCSLARFVCSRLDIQEIVPGFAI